MNRQFRKILPGLKCRHLLFLKMYQFKKRNPRKLNWRLSEQQLKSKFVSVRNKVKGAWWVQKKVDGVRRKIIYLCLDWESRRQEKTLVSLSQTVCFRNTKGGWRIKDIFSIHLHSGLEALKHYSKLSCLFRIVLIYYTCYTRNWPSLL